MYLLSELVRDRDIRIFSIGNAMVVHYIYVERDVFCYRKCGLWLHKYQYNDTSQLYNEISSLF